MTKMVIKVYITGVSASTQLRKHQQDVLDILGGMKIEHQMIDVSIDDEARQFMWTNSKQPEKGKPLPPQIFNGEEYCGGWEEFEVAKENEQLQTREKRKKEKQQKRRRLQKMNRQISYALLQASSTSTLPSRKVQPSCPRKAGENSYFLALAGGVRRLETKNYGDYHGGVHVVLKKTRSCECHLYWYRLRDMIQ
ncbi:SH3 domain-binding glutamic acid-rich-like protein 2 [Branchiostoma belcheri]|nr:SH3 domain-binding glutamic acid-rich-like protein 2 [Branchiostoma belcheri]